MDSRDKKVGKNRNFMSSVEFAFSGLKSAFKEERNMRTHLVFGGLAILGGLLFQIPLSEWRWLLLVIFLVIVLEIINTAFENLVDLVTDYHFQPLAKKVKDMAAAAVLLMAALAVIVGATIFLPHLFQWWQSLGK